MSAMSNLMMFIVAALIAGLAATAFLQTGNMDTVEQTTTASPQIINVVAFNVTNETASYVRFQVTSDEPIRVDEALIRIQQSEEAVLQYRSGALIRDVATGFYTQ